MPEVPVQRLVKANCELWPMTSTRAKTPAVIFATDPNPAVRQKALDILTKRREGLDSPRMQSRAFTRNQGPRLLSFRDVATATRAEVLEELRHLDWARMGNWSKEVAGVFTAFRASGA